MKVNSNPYFELLRLKDSRGYFLMAALGFFMADGYLGSIREIIIFSLATLLLLGFAFSINDCFDTKEDKLDEGKNNPIVLKKISRGKGLIFSAFLVLLGLSLSATLGFKPFLLYFLIALLAFLYSTPPFRLKSRPFLDIAAHGLFAGALLFLIPFLIFGKDLNLLHYLIAFSIFSFSIILEIRNHIEDYETDMEANLNTTVCALGIDDSKKILRYLGIFYPLTLFPIFFLIYPKYLLSFIIITFIFLFLFKKNYQIGKHYRIMDLYAGASLFLVSIATIF